jgi:hypothetical protein
MRREIAFYFSLFILCCMTCTKNSEDLTFDLAPSIELLSMSSDTIREFSETLLININYEDGDGDLGSTDPDINSIFVKDQRLEQSDEYYLGPLAPEGSSISIQGTLNIALANTFILGNADEERTVFTIHVVDRAGNKSNVIETSPITIIR